VHGLHDDQPAEDEAMTTTPHGGHATKHHRPHTRKGGEGPHHEESHLQRRSRAKSY
jgi:hypothetical protein